MIILLLLLYIISSQCQISVQQFNALHSIYVNGIGTGWTFKNSSVAWNFTTTNFNKPCYQWQGIRCNSAGTNVSSLILSQFNVSGTLSSSVGNLTALTILNISNNHNLGGTIPKIISQLRSLVIIDLSSNSLLGQLCSLSNLVNLEFLDLSNNSLTSTIPSFYANSNPQILLLSTNYFTGTIPSLYNGITVLNIGNNNLSSTISQFTSSEFFLPNLKQIILNSNSLTGSVPMVGEFMHQLELVDLSSNMLTGSLSSGIWLLSTLNSLLLSRNFLSGSIYTSSATSSSLVNLDLSFNMFTGKIPAFLFNSSSLEKLAFVSNCFTGSLPQTLCAASSLRYLSLDGVSSSPYCNKIGPYGPISVLYASIFLRLEGSIPACVFNLTNLQSLHLVGNGLTGTIGDIASKSSLQYLYLANNRLTGTIPSSILSYGNFIDVDVSNNKIYGNIENLVTGSNMSSLSLQVNRLSGNVPSSISSVEFQNILDGNLFGCRKLTEYSSDKSLAKSYFCSSELFLTSIIIWLVLFMIGFSFIVWMYVSRGGDEKYTGIIGNIFTYCNNHLLHSWLVSGISRFFSLSPTFHERRAMITEAYNGLQKTSGLIVEEEKSVLHAAFKYLEVQNNTQSSFLFVTLSSFLCFLPTYLFFKGKGLKYAQFSTFEYQYMFITTSAYLHGFHPSIMIITFLSAVLVFAGIIIFRKKYHIKEEDSSIPVTINESQSVNRDSVRSTISWARDSMIMIMSSKDKSRLNDTKLLFSANKRQCIIITRMWLEYSIQLANILFSFGINAFYVYMVSFSGMYYSLTAIYTIQILVAFAKVFLSEIIVPALCRLLKYAYARISNDHVQQHALIMNLTNFIIAPVLATIVVSKSCLYYTYNSYEPSSLSLSFNVPSCLSESILVNGESIKTEFCSALNSNYSYQIVPNFYYNYQCGSAVLVSYLSPLVFVYIIDGLVFPLITFLILVLKEETLEKFPYSLLPSLMSTSYIKPSYVVSRHTVAQSVTSNPLFNNNEPIVARRLSDRKEIVNALFQPSQIIQKYVAVPLTLMLTFGISSPILGITIFVAIISQTFVFKFMIGKYLVFAIKADSPDIVEANLRYAVNSLTNIITEVNIHLIYFSEILIVIIIGGR